MKNINILKAIMEQNESPDKLFPAEIRFLKAIENSIPAGIAAVDPEGRQLYVNKAFCDMVGWSEEELVGAEFPYAYIHPELLEKNISDFQTFVSEVIPPEGVELPFYRKNGEIFWGLVLFTKLKDEQGRLIGRLISVYNITERKRISEALQKSEKQRRILLSKLIRAQEKERKLVSQEIHDIIGGRLSALKYYIEKQLSLHKARQHSKLSVLESVFSMLQKTISETQRISKSLHPSILDDLGILAAIQSFCREFQEIYSQITIEKKFDIREEDISDPLKILIYRVLQEALNNVAKHSGADRVCIGLAKSEDRVMLSVEDNGSGFQMNRSSAVDHNSGGMGLESMKERTELFNGSFEIQSETGRGTIIRAVWPPVSSVNRDL